MVALKESKNRKLHDSSTIYTKRLKYGARFTFVITIFGEYVLEGSCSAIRMSESKSSFTT